VALHPFILALEQPERRGGLHLLERLFGALALSLALTLSIMAWLDIPHAPAGATTLIVSIGLPRTPEQLTILMLAVVLLTAQGFIINRLAGLPYPRWKPRSAQLPTGGGSPGAR